MASSPLREFPFLASLQSQLRPQNDIRVPLGDDGAVVTPPAGQNLVMATDLMVEGVHFELDYTPARAIGHKLLAVNLSDLAAMGAKPRWALISLAIPRDISEAFIQAFYGGLMDLAKIHGVQIVGGDTTGAKKGALTANLTLIGTLEGPSPALTRSGAQVGDGLFICGKVGGASHALKGLMAGRRIADAGEKWADPLFFPVPQVQAGEYFYKHGLVSAMIDISDGLLSDLKHLLRRGAMHGALELGAQIQIPDLPLSPGLEPRRARDLACALHGGEDYALLFTARPEHWPALNASDAPPVRAIGRITETQAIHLIDLPCPETDLGQAWSHFDTPSKGGPR